MNSITSTFFILTFFLSGTIFLGLFITLLILKSKTLKFARFFLGFTLLFLILQLATYLLFTTQLIKSHPHLLGLNYPTLFLVGPSFYFFIKSFNNIDFKFQKIDLLHLVPFVYIVSSRFSFYLTSAKSKSNIISYYYDNVPSGDVLFSEWIQGSLHMLIVTIYVIGSLLHIHKTSYKVDLWIKRVSWAMLALSLTYLITQSGIIFTGANAITAEIILSSLLAIVILTLGYWILDIKGFSPPSSMASYKTSSLSPEMMKDLENKLVLAVEKERPYLDAELKVGSLSTQIDIPRHHISQVLNEHMKSSFYDFINSYRVEAVKKLLRDGMAKKLSIQAIGQECGFSNKTTFYRAFKKFTGTTPNEFLQSIENSCDEDTN